MIKFDLKNKSGFTLLEALVAVSILMVAVSAPITIAQKGLSSAVYAKDQMIAAYLAQDAIEYVKNKRDEVSINNPGFDWAGLSIFNTCFTSVNPDGCQIDTTTTVSPINVFDLTSPLKKDSNNFYQYGSGTPTKFTRQIQIVLNTIGGQPDEALVTVTVKWGTDENKVVVKTLIYNY